MFSAHPLYVCVHVCVCVYIRYARLGFAGALCGTCSPIPPFTQLLDYDM